MKNAFYYFYYKLYGFAILISDDFLNKWKPFVTILVLEILLGTEVLVWHTIITKRIVTIDNSISFFLPIVSVMTMINYFFFLHNDKWELKINEYKEFDKKNGRLGGCLVAGVILIILVSVILSFYMLSKIDWSQYR